MIQLDHAEFNQQLRYTSSAISIYKIAFESRAYGYIVTGLEFELKTLLHLPVPGLSVCLPGSWQQPGSGISSMMNQAMMGSRYLAARWTSVASSIEQSKVASIAGVSASACARSRHRLCEV
jgi:hypothetical protein